MLPRLLSRLDMLEALDRPAGEGMWVSTSGTEGLAAAAGTDSLAMELVRRLRKVRGFVSSSV